MKWRKYIIKNIIPLATLLIVAIMVVILGFNSSLTVKRESVINNNQSVKDSETGEDIDNGTADELELAGEPVTVDTVANGKLEIIKLEMFQFEDHRTRTFRVWLPENYDPANEDIRYPVMYMFDGSWMFSDTTSEDQKWEVDKVITKMMEEGYEGSIVVGMDNGPYRNEEYTPNWECSQFYVAPEGGKTVAFILETLKPYIDEHYNTLADREHTGVGGASLGGLMAYYAGMENLDTFGYILAFSPAFRYIEIKLYSNEQILDIVGSIDVSKPDILPRLYMYVGGEGEEARFTPYVDFVSQAMIEHGYPGDKIKTLIDETQQHDSSAWAKYFPEAYRWLVDYND